MTFSDDDLKRFKERREKLRVSHVAPNMLAEEFDALLARLDASEVRNAYADKVIFDDGESIEYSSGVYEEFEQADKAWQKSAGKGGAS